MTQTVFHPGVTNCGGLKAHTGCGCAARAGLKAEPSLAVLSSLPAEAQSGDQMCAKCGDPYDQHVVSDPRWDADRMLCPDPTDADEGGFPMATEFTALDDGEYQFDQMHAAPFNRSKYRNREAWNYFVDADAQPKDIHDARNIVFGMADELENNPQLTERQKAILAFEIRSLGERFPIIERIIDGDELKSTCRLCGAVKRAPNKGLGRASVAAWETGHQH